MRFKKWLLLPISIIGLMTLTNPSYDRFTEFTGVTKKENDFYLRRTANYLVLSIYQDDYNQKEYLGIALNFFYLKDIGMPIEEGKELMPLPLKY